MRLISVFLNWVQVLPFCSLARLSRGWLVKQFGDPFLGRAVKEVSGCWSALLTVHCHHCMCYMQVAPSFLYICADFKFQSSLGSSVVSLKTSKNPPSKTERSANWMSLRSWQGNVITQHLQVLPCGLSFSLKVPQDVCILFFCDTIA